MSGITSLADRGCWQALAAALRPWLPSQRWFQGKAKALEAVAVDDVAVLTGPPDVADVFVHVTYARGQAERYQVPLVAQAGLGRVGDVEIADALASPDAARTVAAWTLDAGSTRTAAGGEVRAAPVDGPQPLPQPARALGVEQSNTSVVFGDTLLLKVFRRVEAGLNPDVELTRALTERGFAHVPAQAGACVLVRDGEESALAVCSTFLAGAREGWDLALEEARAASRGDAPAAPLGGHARALGEVLGDLHRTLADAFGARPAAPADLAAWSQAMHDQLDAVEATASERAPAVAETLSLHRTALRDRFDALAVLDDAGSCTRTHGDLHLGQVLHHDRGGWQILDFEGEPARPLAERRRLHSPLRDVAGMLRSFDYAAAHEAVDPPPVVARWRDAARHAFLDGYLERTGHAGLLPADPGVRGLLAGVFELDKAVYELGYELANRPAWVGIPLAGILRVLAAGTDDERGGAA